MRRVAQEIWGVVSWTVLPTAAVTRPAAFGDCAQTAGMVVEVDAIAPFAIAAELSGLKPTAPVVR